MSTHGRHVEIRGTVQGVGFRPWVFRLATQHGLTGWVRNDGSGVTLEVFGPAASLERFSQDLRSTVPAAARIAAIAMSDAQGPAPGRFEIVASAASSARHVSIPPDLATCEACLAEVFDPGDRRFRYPFTNCTDCGPRFTIARQLPYDRPHTTMAPFRMCERCQREYDDTGTGVFTPSPTPARHAVRTCGLCRPDGTTLEVADPLAHAATLLRSGAVVAVKGLGGFHLACDATNPDAVAALRHRKRRDEKPLAVMAATLDAAERLAVLNDVERRLLTSAERPILIVAKRGGCGLAEHVAPANPTVGLMLPYSPLHHLMVADAGLPLVMTSGNVSDEPLAYRNDDALNRLGAIADVFLLHDRDIDARCDDSVARVIAGRPVVFRRSRGFTPRAIRVPFRFAQPTLAVGALLKNTFCLGVEDEAWLGPHVGDLENLETYESFEEAVRRMEHVVGVVPEVIAHDLHPDYLSTRYAETRPAARRIGVQHHHAHIASAMTERGLTGPALGVAFDGTGFGTDGTAWGGEFLLVDGSRCTRLGTFRPLALAGGDVAIRQVWRQALAALVDACDGDVDTGRFRVFGAVPLQDILVVRQMLAASLNTTAARGVGRYFDAAGALGLVRAFASHEGQVALDWNLAADPSEHAAYPFACDEAAGVLTVDLRPAFRAFAADILRGVPAPLLSARFHNMLAAAAVSVVRMLLARLGPLPVVLSGGCFQNARLTESVVAALGSAVQVVRHEWVPPGDGGLALGQAAVAQAVMAAGA